MKLEIDYGLAGSGKSKYIKELFAAKLEADEKLMILVPDQHSFITERSVLEDFGARRGSKIKVIWFNNLARVITETYGGVKPEVLDNAGKAVLMSKAIEQCSAQLSYYKKQAARPDFIAGMLNFSTELKYSKTDLKALASAADASGSAVLKQKIEEISMISRSFDALVEETYLNPDDILTDVNAILEHESFFEGYTVAIDGFGFFDKQKLDIIAQIIRQSKETYITLCTDSLQLGQMEGDKFEAVKRTAHKLILAAQQIGAQVQTRCFEDLSAMRAPFRYLSRGIYTPSAAPFEKECGEVQIAQCANVQRECDYAALQIKKLIMHCDYRYRDIAVIVRDEESYLPYLKRSFAAQQIPFFKDARRSVMHEPLFLFCHYALKCCADNFRLEDVMACIKSAVTGMDTREISDFENYCIIWNINGKRKWSGDFAYNPAGFTERMREEDEALLERVNATRRKTVIPLLQFANRIKGATVGETAAALYALLEQVQAAKNLKRLAQSALQSDNDILKEQSEVWALLMHCLDQLVATRGGEVLPAKTVLNILDLAAANSNIGVLPQRIDEILVGSAERIRTDLPKAAFLLGVNEGLFPKGFSDGGILSDAERTHLLKQGVELGSDFRVMSLNERFFAYCAALAPSEYLFVSYNSSNLEGESLAASSLIKEIRRVLPLLEVQHASDTAAEDILSPAQGFDVMARLWREDSTLRQTLYEIYSQSDAYAAKTQLIESGDTQAPKQIAHPDTALQLFGEVMAISPTQLENYSKCPFMYFCKYGLKARPAEKAALDARTGGTLIHYVLEHLVREEGKQGLIAMSAAERRAATDRYIAQYLEVLHLPEEFVTGRFRYIVSKNRNIILATLEQMAEEMRQSDFEPTDFELKVGGNGAGYEVPLAQGKVSLMGMVDRVDSMQKGDNKYFRIIDYKTGNKSFKLGEVLYGINAQMLIYLLSLSAEGGEKYSGSVPAGLLYIEAKDKCFNASHGNPDEVAKKKEERYQMNGMLLKEEEVIYGMEHEPSGRFIPISFDKNGNIKGNLVTRRQMEQIREKLDAIIADMGNALHSGSIDDMPLKTASSHACDYCDYKAVCRNRDKCKEVSIPKFEQVLDALEEAEGGAENG
ncbi:MAG: PD-(D/E)XK nuclease family protein [Clostridia bacterium]|nr:PD-(D/E)XK nuclease family protein [Clostridia bacterium]